MEMDIKTVNECYCKKQIDNNFPWCVLLSTIEMASKCSKLYRETTRRSSWFHLSFEHFDIISVVDKSTDNRKLLLIF